MFKLDISKLQEGDIILERYPEDRTSCKIMELTGSNYSHALVYVGICSIIEAGDIVISNNPQYRVYKSEDDVRVMRLKSELYSQEKIDEVIIFLRSQIGTEYSVPDAYRILESPTTAKSPNRQTCTRLVAQAYQAAGISIVNNADYCTPKEIETSSKLVVVEGIIIPCIEDEAFLSDNDSILDKQEFIISSLLEECSEIIGPEADIQTFDQLSIATYGHPEKIDAIIKAIKDSGYLDLWKDDKESHPYDFDENLFLEKYSDYAAEQACTQMYICERQIRLFIHNLLAHQCNLNINGDNLYVKLMIQFYSELIDWSLGRYRVAFNIYNQRINEELN